MYCLEFPKVIGSKLLQYTRCFMPKVHSINDIATALSVLNDITSSRSLKVARAMLLADIAKVCSATIEDSKLCWSDKEYFKKNGIRFVGEAPRFLAGQRYPMAPIKRRFATTFCLKQGTDPVDVGWRPPYWDDPDFTALLDTPCCVYFGTWSNWEHKRADGYKLTLGTRTLARWLHGHGIHYMGQYLAYVQRNYSLELPTEELERTEQHRLWAGALVPSQWQPPKSIPDEWLLEEKKIAEEVEYYEMPRAWVVEWNIIDGRYGGYRRLITSYIEAEGREVEYPYVRGAVQFKSNCNTAYFQIRRSTFLPVDGEAVNLLYHERASSSRCFNDGVGWRIELNSPHTGHRKYTSVTWHLKTYFHAARAFSSKEVAEAFLKEIESKTDQDLEDSD